MIKKLLARSGFYFTGLVIHKLFSTLVFILLARILLPEGFGQLTFFITLAILITNIGDFGLIQWYQKTIYKNSMVKNLNSIINARLITLFLSIIFAIIFLFIFRPFSLFISLILLLLLIPEAFLSIMDAYYLVAKRPLNIALKNILKTVVLLIFFLIFKSRLNLPILSLALLAGSILMIVWYLPWTKLKNFSFLIKNGINTLKKSSSYAILIFTSLTYSRGDSILIKLMLGNFSLGIYAAAYRYLESLSLLPTALSQNLFHLSAKKEGLKLKQLIKITLIMTVVGFTASLLFYLITPLITLTILGKAYQGSIIIARIFSLVTLLFFINAPLSTVVQSSNLLNKFLPWGIFNTTLNIILNIAILPIYGLIAAAWIMVLTEFTGLIINIIFILLIYRNKKDA